LLLVLVVVVVVVVSESSRPGEGKSCDSSSSALLPLVPRDEDPFVRAQMLPYVLVRRMYTYV
jgi:hypothetical protein